MTSLHNRSALVFDLDGTLVHSLEDIAGSANHTLGTLGLPQLSIETIQGYVGHGVRDLISSCLGNDNGNLIDKALDIFTKHYSKNLITHTRLYPGVLESLEKLYPDFRLFVLSNKREDFSRMIVKGLNMGHYFTEIFGGDSFKLKKPDPMAINYIIEHYRADPGLTIMIGDNYTDIETAERAKIRSIFFRSGMGKLTEAEPTVSVASFLEIPSVIQHLTGI